MLAFVACAPEPVTPRVAAPFEKVAPAPTAEVFRLPQDRCVDPLDAPLPTPPTATDDAPITVRKKGAGFSLETRGAAAGRVLAALGRAAGRPVRAEGFGAAVPIWAFVPEDGWETIAEAVARSAGLIRVRREADDDVGDAVVAFVDPQIAAQAWMRAFRESSMISPIETRLIPVTHPREMARVLATSLSCRGELVAAPARGFVVASDVSESLNQMERLVWELERPPSSSPAAAAPLGNRRAERADSLGKKSGFVRCDRIAPVRPRNAERALLDGDGIAAGDLVVQLARTAKTAAVVGCGGDRPVFAHVEGDTAIADAARAGGLAAIDTTTFVAEEMAQQIAVARSRVHIEPDPPELRIFDALHAEELAVTIAALYGGEARFRERVDAIAYVPMGRVVVRAPISLMNGIEELVLLWRP